MKLGNTVYILQSRRSKPATFSLAILNHLQPRTSSGGTLFALTTLIRSIGALCSYLTTHCHFLKKLLFISPLLWSKRADKSHLRQPIHVRLLIRRNVRLHSPCYDLGLVGLSPLSPSKYQTTTVNNNVRSVYVRSCGTCKQYRGPSQLARHT